MARRGPWLEAHIETKPPRFKPRVRGRRPRSFSSPPRKRGPLEGLPPLRCTDPLRSLSAQGTTIRASPQPCRRLDDRQEFRRGQARAANQRAVDVARAEQFGGIVTIDRATIEEARSEEHTSELQSLMRTSYAVF